MSADRLRNIIGFSIVVSHFFAIFYIVMALTDIDLWVRVQVALIISPIFSVFSIAVVKDFISLKESLESSRVLNASFCVLAIFITWCFVAYVFIALAMFTLRTIASPDDLKTFLSISETSFGVFLGLIVDALFGGERNAASNQR
jgi:hypothetical protein